MLPARTDNNMEITENNPCVGVTTYFSKKVALCGCLSRDSTFTPE